MKKEKGKAVKKAMKFEKRKFQAVKWEYNLMQGNLMIKDKIKRVVCMKIYVDTYGRKDIFINDHKSKGKKIG